jgi:hypothetical protein
MVEPAVAFAAHRTDPPALEVRVNFGIFAGRQATPAEIDDLARELLPDVHEISIVAEQRHEISDASEISLHQVRIEVVEEQLPPTDDLREELSERVVEIAERWALACVADRHTEI